MALAGSDSLRARRSAAGAPRRLRGVLVPSMRGARVDARVGQPVRAAGLERCGNNKRQACRELGISYHTLRSHLQFRPERPGAGAGGAEVAELIERVARSIAGGAEERSKGRACRAPPATGCVWRGSAIEDDRGGCAPHRSLPENGLHQRESGMAGRVMLAAVLAIAMAVTATPRVRKRWPASAGQETPASRVRHPADLGAHRDRRQQEPRDDPAVGRLAGGVRDYGQ